MSDTTGRNSWRAAVTFRPCPHGDGFQSDMPNEHREDCILWSTDDGLKWFQIAVLQRVEPPYELTVRGPAEQVGYATGGNSDTAIYPTGADRE